MEIRSNFTYGNKAVNESYTAKANKLGTGKKMSETSSDAASLQIKTKTNEVSESAIENINAAASSAADVAKAEAMIHEANRRILEQSDDSVLAQANQSTDTVTKLLD
ncbi:MAG: hypothetical protein OSJ73_03055 [Lachnospiraceae bacterium]|jgi:hypothetical protein|nr:hypothetical protein [Lachnospiraceae bacterium]